MSFAADWLAEFAKTSAVIRPRLPLMGEAYQERVAVLDEISGRLARAVTVRLRGDQAQVFLDTPRVEGQDYATWLRLPYPSLFVAPESPLQFHGYLSEAAADMADTFMARARAMDMVLEADQVVAQAERDIQDAKTLRMRADRMGVDPALRTEVHRVTEAMAEAGRDMGVSRDTFVALADRLRLAADTTGRFAPGSDPAVKGVLLYEDVYPQPVLTHEAAYSGVLADSEKAAASTSVYTTRRLAVVFFMPHPSDPLALHSANLRIGLDGALHTSRVGFWQTRNRMIDWAIHLVNFLSSPSVKLVRAEHDAKLQRSRAKSGKPPLPGWYEITYAKHVQDYSGAKVAEGKRWEHGYRYDVRGHFKRFEQGRMAGRVLWCPPHQRGLRHALYKPKGYVTEAT